jgi:uncharacterized protein (DUF983 family)
MNFSKTYLVSALNNRCPRCREGYLFKSTHAYKLKGNTAMNETCPVCHQPTEIEVGFYYGTGYVSYAITVALSVATFVAWKVLIGLSFDIDDNRIFYWLGTNILLLVILQPLIMRLARTMWLGFFVKYEKDWIHKPLKKPERINKDQFANW